MKKDFKNKSIKILITSLLCGLAFTCVNVSAMRENDNKDNNTKIISTDSTTKNNENLDKKEKNTIKEKFDRLYKKAIDDIEYGYFSTAVLCINKINEILKEGEVNIDTNTKKYFEEKLNEINKNLNATITSVHDGDFSSIKQDIFEIKDYESEKIEEIINRIHMKKKIIEKKITNKTQTCINDATKEYFKDKFEEIYEFLGDKIMHLFEKGFDEIESYICKKYLNIAREKLDSITSCRYKYTSYLSYEYKREFRNKINYLENKYSRQQEMIGLDENIKNLSMEIMSYLKLGNIYLASNKIKNIENLINRKKDELKLTQDEINHFNKYLSILNENYTPTEQQVNQRLSGRS